MCCCPSLFPRFWGFVKLTALSDLDITGTQLYWVLLEQAHLFNLLDQLFFVLFNRRKVVLQSFHSYFCHCHLTNVLSYGSLHVLDNTTINVLSHFAVLNCALCVCILFLWIFYINFCLFVLFSVPLLSNVRMEGRGLVKLHRAAFFLGLPTSHIFSRKIKHIITLSWVEW